MPAQVKKAPDVAGGSGRGDDASPAAFLAAGLARGVYQEGSLTACVLFAAHADPLDRDGDRPGACSPSPRAKPLRAKDLLRFRPRAPVGSCEAQVTVGSSPLLAGAPRTSVGQISLFCCIPARQAGGNRTHTVRCVRACSHLLTLRGLAVKENFGRAEASPSTTLRGNHLAAQETTPVETPHTLLEPVDSFVAGSVCHSDVVPAPSSVWGTRLT